MKDSNKFKPLLLMCYNNPDWWQFEAIPHCKYVFESETVADEWIAAFEAAANIFATLRPEAAGAVVGCLLGGAKGGLKGCLIGAVAGAVVLSLVDLAYHHDKGIKLIEDHWLDAPDALIIRPWEPHIHEPPDCPNEPKLHPGRPQPVPPAPPHQHP